MVANKSKAVPEFKFTPLVEFEWWRETEDDDGNVVDRMLIGQYLPGQTYNCTREMRHDTLREKCRQWEAEGKIKIMYLSPNQEFKTIKVRN